MLLTAAVLQAAAAGKAAAGPPAAARVIQVLDGDTIILADGCRVRYLGLDTPELEAPEPRERALGRRAREVNAALVQGQEVRLEYDREHYDQYNRVLAYVFTPDGTMINAALVAQGLARVMITPPNLRYQALLVEQQRRAIAARRGIWQELPRAEEPSYRGNRQTWRFHRPGCPAAKRIAPANRLNFATPLAAYLEGFFPCRLCRP